MQKDPNAKVQAVKWDEVPVMLSAQQAADVIGYGAYRIRELCKAGKMPHVRYGKAYRIPRDTLREWLDIQAKAMLEVEAG